MLTQETEVALIIFTQIPYRYSGNATVVVLDVNPYHEGRRLVSTLVSTTDFDGVPNRILTIYFRYWCNSDCAGRCIKNQEGCNNATPFGIELEPTVG